PARSALRGWSGQNGGSSFAAGAEAQGSPPLEPPLACGAVVAHGSLPPSALPEPERVVFVVLAVAYRSDGPISSTSSSKTVRFSPSRVSNERCLSRPWTITREPRVRLSAT